MLTQILEFILEKDVTTPTSNIETNSTTDDIGIYIIYYMYILVYI